MSPTAVRLMTAADWPDVERVYAAGIATGNATFESSPPTWEHFDSSKRDDLRFVAENKGRVVGWVAASPVSDRDVYRGVVEHSVYVDPAVQGRGIGHALLNHFIEEADATGVWTIQSSLFPENEASRVLHKAHGFREVGTRERIALMSYGHWKGQWRDTLLIEHRS